MSDWCTWDEDYNLGIVEVYLTYQDGKFVPYQIVVGNETDFE